MTKAPELDAMLNSEQCAKWLGLSEQRFLKKTRGRKAKIPAFPLNGRVIRFHPRTIIAKLATDAGVPMPVIAASFGMTMENLKL